MRTTGPAVQPLVTDTRLLAPAAATWLGAGLVGMLPDAGAPLLLTGAAVVCALVMFAVARARRPGTRARMAGWGRPAAVAIAAACGLAGAGTAMAHQAALHGEPLQSWVISRATADVVGVVITEPVTTHPRGGRAWQESTQVRLATTRIAARGTRVAVEVPVVLRVREPALLPEPGTWVRAVGRLGPAMPGSDAAAVLYVTSIEEWAGPGPVDRTAHAMRIGLRAALDGADPDAGALVAGLAVGDESTQPPDLADAMRRSGLAHLTAVSGGNLAIVVTAAMAAAVVMGLPLLGRLMLVLCAVAGFVVLVGPQPSVLRATAMATVVLVGALAGGRRAGPSVLAVAVIVLVLLSPGLSTSYAFALSVMATGGLVLLAPAIQARLVASPARRLPAALREALALTLAAQAATLPVLVLMGAAAGWVAIPANLLAMPVVPLVTVLGLAAAACSPVLPGLALALAHLAAWPAAWIAAVARAASQAPLAVLPWPSGAAGVALLALAVAGLAAVRHWSPGLLRAASPGALLAMALALGLWLVSPPERRSWPPPDWLVVMCDVGQGDMLVLHAGPGAAVVVDAGPDPALADGCLARLGVDRVPVVALTHFHADHVDGLPGVLRGRDIGSVLVTPVRDPPEEAAAVARLLADRGLAAAVARPGQVGITGQVAWQVLWPRRVIADGSFPNNASVVLLVEVRGRRVLLTGDVEWAAQSALLPDLAALVPRLAARGIDVAKVPHHGSADQHSGLPGVVGAGIALVSVGAGNPYGHPAPATVAAWQAAGALVARTDLSGDVAVVATEAGVGLVVSGGMLPS
ncbi:MAG: ComEC/Rec2 family competence protein [Actinomycetota bacterium]|nr:ComEC/Rec2 family competence protein [Actinomycetota bacterium]